MGFEVPRIGSLLSFLKARVTMITKGVGLSDKVRLIFWATLDLIPMAIARRFPPCVVRSLEDYKSRLSRKTVLRLNGCTFQCLDSESVLILSREFERWMWNYLDLKRGEAFIDVGAHIGKYAVQVAKVVGDEGFVVAVEANPENYSILVKNIELNRLRNVTALNLAAWNENCKLKLFMGDKGGHHSVKKDFKRGYILVDAAPLDDILESLNVKNISHIKIDVEGAELEVLKGLARTLRAHRPRVIVEIWTSPAEVTEFVRKMGYRVRGIAKDYYLLEPSENWA